MVSLFGILPRGLIFFTQSNIQIDAKMKEKKHIALKVLFLISFLFIFSVTFSSDSFAYTYIRNATVLADSLTGNFGGFYDPNTNYGTSNVFYIDFFPGDNVTGYLTFDISIFPLGTVIIDANFQTFASATDADIYFWHLYPNATWNETLITWNNQPCGNTFSSGFFMNETYCNLTSNSSLFLGGANGYFQIIRPEALKEWIELDLNYGLSNTSIAFKNTNGQTRNFSSRESSNPEFLTVTYSVPNITATISASTTSGQHPLSVSFISTTTGGTSPYTYLWNFGDGTNSTSANPSHTYSEIGTYVANVTVTDSESEVQISNNLSIVVTPTRIESLGAVGTLIVFVTIVLSIGLVARTYVMIKSGTFGASQIIEMVFASIITGVAVTVLLI